ncbi:CGNR zinc finger domain-containing protein [Streptomyces sp. NBC_01803]|uniref:CGNR zinc finger domain-containing protein n=1 Tax=Streptomyces sp. NBC_01803 TaxID=2975946 RepID=UPI002DDA0248|nr:ABATE domain-containing protein [Streptomyces sp. NBC_01803]WSA45724.1 ABATE domain-containing protein [Streptomyces sp. NBC_01803]
MTSSATGLVLRSATGAPYRFDPGTLCLELLPTGGPSAFARYEVLHEPADLADWAGSSRLTPTPAVAVSPEELVAARALRDALWRLALARAEGAPVTPADLAVVNEAAARPALAPSAGPDGERAWAGPLTGERLLATVARDAVELLTGPFRDRIRMCSGERCHLVYVDTSRPGSRRWCSMEHCGNRHKVRASRARARRSGEPEEGKG